ncbi:MAG: ATPase RavA [Phycisphaerae bacterium]|nr:ATPase RavA [Phycisphaerae bacterium]
MSDVQYVEALKKAYDTLQQQIRRVVVGQDEVVEQVLISIFARGHSLLVGVPGLAKTLLVSSLARSLSLSFARIQFTPDLMPADITGTEVIQDDPTTGERKFKFLNGPLFHHIVLADEINRTPPKTQAALLEAMQERSVSIGGVSHRLPEPFFVLATQNPIEQEGTYPLPEAQLDRFLFNIIVDYPSDDEEKQIQKLATSESFETTTPEPVLGGEEILTLQKVIRRVAVSDHVFDFARRLVRMTRVTTDEAPDFVKRYLTWGAGPRGSLNLIVAGKARAVLKGRFHVATEDIVAVARPVLRHRIITNFTAQSEGISPDDIVEKLLDAAGKELQAAAN